MRNRGYSYTETIDRRADGRRLVDWMAARWRHSPAAVWLQRIEAGELSVDGRIARADEILRRGQKLQWRRPPWDEPDVPLDWRTLHVDEDLLVVSKPSGLPTMPAGGFYENTLTRLVAAAHPGADPVHRLGRHTSGLVVFSLSELGRRKLSAAFRERRVRKVYRALAEGTPTWERVEIRTPIGPVEHALLGTIHAASDRGNAARSEARVVSHRDDAALLDVEITTGRPHQIRIHLASVGHPLVGDPLYLSGGHARPDALPGDGGYLLHAHLIEFEHPRTLERLRLVADPPPNLR